MAKERVKANAKVKARGKADVDMTEAAERFRTPYVDPREYEDMESELLRRSTLERPDCVLHPDLRTSTQEFNLAMEWMQYSRGTAQLIADYLHEADKVDLQDTALAIEAVATMIRESANHMSRANGTLRWEYATALGLPLR